MRELYIFVIHQIRGEMCEHMYVQKAHLRIKCEDKRDHVEYFSVYLQQRTDSNCTAQLSLDLPFNET